MCRPCQRTHPVPSHRGSRSFRQHDRLALFSYQPHGIAQVAVLGPPIRVSNKLSEQVHRAVQIVLIHRACPARGGCPTCLALRENLREKRAIGHRPVRQALGLFSTFAVPLWWFFVAQVLRERHCANRAVEVLPNVGSDKSTWFLTHGVLPHKGVASGRVAIGGCPAADGAETRSTRAVRYGCVPASAARFSWVRCTKRAVSKSAIMHPLAIVCRRKRATILRCSRCPCPLVLLNGQSGWAAGERAIPRPIEVTE